MQMGKFIDRTGQVFGRLTVLYRVESNTKKGTKWACQCECGNVKNILSDNLISGTTKSCGCWKTELHTTHGFSQLTTKEEQGTYHVWESMRQRILNRKHKAYKNYGGRGITIDSRWETFAGFLADMGVRPAGHSIERIDNDGPYSPGNCKWATRKEQDSNMQKTRLVEYLGKKVTLSELSKITGINLSRLRHRCVVQGLSVEDTIRMPAYSPKRKLSSFTKTPDKGAQQ
jgi:hypothetical protein